MTALTKNWHGFASTPQITRVLHEKLMRVVIKVGSAFVKTLHEAAERLKLHELP